MPFPPKKPGLGVIIDLKGPGPLDRKPGFPPKRPLPGGLSARNSAQETPAEETGYHEQGERPAPTPESVLYHGEQDRCDGCEYYKVDSCDFLQQPVDAGGHCQRYEAKGEDSGEETSPDMEQPGGEAAEYGQ